jgi:hypothetical protein
VELSKLTEGLELTEAGIKVFEERTRSERQQLYKELMGMFACYEENLKEKRYLSRQISVLDFILIVMDSGIDTCVAVH